MDEQIKVGGEVDAYCTSCRLMKWHVIVAVVGDKPAKVECHGCHKQHGFRAAPPGAPKVKRVTKPRAASTPAPAPPVTNLEERLLRGESSARGYSPQDQFAVDELVRHPSFGVGLVVALPDLQRMEVAFRDGRKLLVHRRGAPPPPGTLTRPVRRHEEDVPRGATDAPPDKH